MVDAAPHVTTDREALLQSVAVAIEQGIAEAVALHHRVDDSVETLRAAAERLRRTAPLGLPAVEEFCSFAEQASASLDDLFARQQSQLSTYNIAFFGRTGAGKSTLLSAFGELDGYLVSQGESDWTTDVQSVTWNGCQLIDTPGINGWGRTMSRSHLEARARGAVEICDVVILCFDDQSQQFSEFAKIAEWVRDYGKPVIAVLNVRTARWRQPALVPDESKRMHLSQTVREHARNIEASLESIGLTEVPIVAINSRRALDALATDPYFGPDGEGRAHRLLHYGADLLPWSNFPLLDALLSEVIAQGASHLRTAALRDGVRKSLEGWRGDLQRVRDAGRTAAKRTEDTIEGALGILGYPESTDRNRVIVEGVDLLDQSQKTRKQPYRAGPYGELSAHSSRLLKVHLAPVRARAMGAAEELVWESFQRGEAVTESQFRSRVFDNEAIETAAQQVFREALAYSRDRLSLVAEDNASDLRFEGQGRTVDGGAGDTTRHASTALRISGLLTGTAGTLGAFALADFWNPLGWGAGIAATVALVGAVVSGVFGWLASRLGRSHEQKRASERSRAIANARRSVNDAFDDLEERITLAIQGESWRQAGDRVAGLLQTAIALRMVNAEAATAAQRIRRTAAKIGPAPNPADVMKGAVKSLARARGFDGEADALLRGEDWLTDHEARQAAPAGPGDHQLPSELALPMDTWLGPDPGDFQTWLDQLSTAAMTWPHVQDLISTAHDQAVCERPSIALVGDYSAGKSSLIRRLLVDQNLPVPADLRISGAPETNQVRSYPWDRYRLVDTPGFQSGHDGHDSMAMTGVASAFLVLFVMPPQGLTGDLATLDEVLGGSVRMPAKGHRSVFLISRADSLVAEPADAPDEFRRMRLHKIAEVQRGLASKGYPVSDRQVWCIAADPFGLAREATLDRGTFDAFRVWDGIAELVQPLLSAAADDVGRASRYCAAEAVLHGLMNDSELLLARSGELGAQAAVLEALVAVLEEARRVAETHEKSFTADAQLICQRNAHELLSHCLEATTNSELRTTSASLSKWWKDPGFIAEADHFQQRAQKAVDRWLRQYAAQLNRQVLSPQFARAYPELAAELRTGLKDRSTVKGAATTFNATTKVASQITRDAVLDLGHMGGVKFRPWGAVKVASRVNKVGGVLSAAGVVLDTGIWIKERKDAQRRESAREKAYEFTQRTIPPIANQLSGASGESGPVAYLRDARRQLDLIGDALSAELATCLGDLALAEAETAALACLIASTRSLSGRTTDPGDPHGQ